ncbi:MAG: hypothetical protein KGY48_02395 [Wenzhouxiangellaceae bacterium]|nr:hypothetical protein [Wenzhouxiangellaceae bacterium]
MIARYLIASILLSVGAARIAAEVRPECAHVLVDIETMRAVIEDIDGYNTAAAINQSRFVADFLFGLAARADVSSAAGTFQIQPERFFQAWLDVTGERAEDAPVSMRKVLEYNQRFVVDSRPVIQLSPASLRVENVLAVHISWPQSADAADHYTYEDTMADPTVRLRHERVINYILIDFGEFVAYENLEGIRGKPTSGGLGALFGFLGTARILSSRFTVAGDQTQVNRSLVKKLFPFTMLTTISSDGTAERGIPDDRDDLQALADRLDIEIDIRQTGPFPEPCDIAP